MTDLEVLSRPLSQENLHYYRGAITNAVFLKNTFVKEIGGVTNFSYYGSQLDNFNKYQYSSIDRLKLSDITIMHLEDLNNCLYSFLYHSFNFFYRLIEVPNITDRSLNEIKRELANWFHSLENLHGVKNFINQLIVDKKFYDAIYVRKYYETALENAVLLLTSNSIALRLCPLNIVLSETNVSISNSVNLQEIEMFLRLRGEEEQKALCSLIINVDSEARANLVDNLATIFKGKKGKPLAIMVYLLRDYEMLNPADNSSELHRALDRSFDWEIGRLSGFTKILRELPGCEDIPSHIHRKELENYRKLMDPLKRFKT